MAYSSGGLIEASDYNALVGSNSTTAGTINYVWNTGNGEFGYGQGAIATVSASSTVTATQWATMLNGLNRSLGHQSGAGAQLGPLNYTAGQTVTQFANVTTGVSTINTNKALYTAQGSTTTGANFDQTLTTSTGLTTASQYGVRTVTFASADAARYFFNAGGQLNYVLATTTAGGSGAQQSLIRMIGAIGGWGQRNTTSTGRTGTGLTLAVNNTTYGYRDNTTTQTTMVQVTDTTASYTGNNAYLQVRRTNTDATNGANGSIIEFRTLFDVDDKTWDDSISCNFRTRVDIVYPETTYLSSSPWGTPSVS